MRKRAKNKFIMQIGFVANAFICGRILSLCLFYCSAQLIFIKFWVAHTKQNKKKWDKRQWKYVQSVFLCSTMWRLLAYFFETKVSAFGVSFDNNELSWKNFVRLVCSLSIDPHEVSHFLCVVSVWEDRKTMTQRIICTHYVSTKAILWTILVSVHWWIVCLNESKRDTNSMSKMLSASRNE